MPQARQAAAAVSEAAAVSDAAHAAPGADVADQVDAYARRTVGEALSARAPTDAKTPAASRPAVEAPGSDEASTDGSHDHVGIVMAKSAEGDAVARFFAGRAEVIEQPAFWEIRSVHRLVIPYEISEELGYDIDAYSIQHEMSTHYGRMVATDDALILFSDPAEAMEHLLS
jgi:propane monooxygenase coupling protein